MPDKPPSPEAMRAANIIANSLGGAATMFKLNWATIIDQEMKPKWKNCSERMPAKEDGG